MAFNFEHEIILENDKVLLRPLQFSDLENLKHFSITQPELWQYSLLQAIGEEGLKKYLQLAITARQAQKEFSFIVWDKTKKQYAGSTRFYDIQLSQKCLQLGYTWYGKEFQGTGLNKNCKYLLLQYAFENMQMERVEFRADNANTKSIAAMKSIGCTVEGILRSNGFNPLGQRRDSIVLSILKTEWESGVKEMLRNKL